MSTLGKRLLRVGLATVMTLGLLCLATPAVAQGPGAAPPPPPSDAPPPAANPNPDASPPGTAPPPGAAPAPGAAPGAAPPPGGPPPGAGGPPPAGPKEPWWKDTREAKNSIFVEGMGAGLFYSLNYERVIGFGLAARIGFAYWSMSASAGTASAKLTTVAIPIAINYIGLSRGSHGLEIGAGTTLYYVSGEASSGGVAASGSGMTAWGNLNVGYRYQPRRMGFQFRIGFQMLIGRGLGWSNLDPTAVGAFPWGYISVGFTI